MWMFSSPVSFSSGSVRARAANFVHVPLRQHGAKPCAELAAPVKIIEERFSAALGFAQAVQIGVERIGQLARVGILPGAESRDSARGAVKLGAELRDEEIPRRGTADGCTRSASARSFACSASRCASIFLASFSVVGCAPGNRFAALRSSAA